MLKHPGEDRLQDYLEDLLCREERAELEAHLARCEPCTARVRAERELRRALAALPRAIEPPPHVLAGIHAALDARPLRLSGGEPGRPPASFRHWGERSLASLRYPLAAAAVLLVAASVALTLWLARAPAPAPLAAAPDPVVRAVLAAEPRYLEAAHELESVLAQGEHLLSPATVQLVRDNLRVIDAALAEARAALRNDPNNGALAELLRAAHEQKLELLRRATRTSAAS